MNFKRSKIYITGVSGFVGSRVAKICLEQGYDVVGITRNSASTVANELGIDVITADLNDKNNLKLEKAEAIIHCASANEILSNNISDGLSLTIIGTSNLLEASRIAKISNIIFFSTAQVYGTELNGYIDELTPVHCQTSYAINHYFGEELCRFYCQTQKFNISVIRPSNIYGVPEISSVHRNTLVPICFVDEAIKNNQITLRSSGKQTRNFVSIDDVANLVIKTLKNFPKGFFIQNCGSNFCLSIFEIAKLVSNEYEIYFNKKIDINVNSNQPENSNIFEYKSRFNKFLDSQNDYQMKIRHTINQLFNLHKNI